MVNKIFYIKGENIFNVGLRPGILGKAKRFNIKTDPINIEEEKRVRVVASGTAADITAFHKYVRDNDVRIKQTGEMYQVTDLEVYKGPKIDWNYVVLSSLSEQMDKGFNEGNTGLQTINQTINNKFDAMDKKFGSIGETLKNIDSKLRQSDA